MDEAEVTVPFTVQCSHTEVSRLPLQITMLGNSGEKILREFLTLYNFGFFIDPVNIIISCVSMPSFHYNCVLLITYNPDNVMKNNSNEVSVLYYKLWT